MDSQFTETHIYILYKFELVKLTKIQWLYANSQLARWKFTTGAVPRQYRRRISDTGRVMVQYRHGNWPDARMITRLGVGTQYWSSSISGYWYSTI